MGRRLEARTVAAFDSTHEALEAERICRERGVAGRLIPTPTAIRADCGLAWAMPPEARGDFEEAARHGFVVAGLYDLEL
ncbi:DUF3343 domain-containing protein [Olsenella massiliensis]|uniref:DUF3343 domain-containing protein n=1 Tax=Olsenella massiliensis TaxID=1622075 RepID=UPI00071CFE4B|nr:DUF3343 domain-containing protein [Olsenella massiliensis]